ncbi:hypothetical protein BGY98DRAFT_934927 [Russula aff. rugulosa BPL654]|nr:hypothetical protein BGY98DRAFT_934927 [Russula aff. rugulosa BPL654]
MTPFCVLQPGGNDPKFSAALTEWVTRDDRQYLQYCIVSAFVKGNSIRRGGRPAVEGQLVRKMENRPISGRFTHAYLDVKAPKIRVAVCCERAAEIVLVGQFILFVVMQIPLVLSIKRG